MTNPKHPVKVVIVIRGGLVDAIFTDKEINARFFIADYDAQEDSEDYRMVDYRDQVRRLTEDTAMLDTAAVRNIINKRRGKDE